MATFHEHVFVYWKYVSDPMFCIGISHFDHKHMFGTLYNDETTTNLVDHRMYAKLLKCGLMGLRVYAMNEDR